VGRFSEYKIYLNGQEKLCQYNAICMSRYKLAPVIKNAYFLLCNINIKHLRFPMRFLLSFLLVFLIAAPVFVPQGHSFNSTWNYDQHSIPVEEIMSGGPPKDGIPALTNPNYVSAQKASFLRKDDQVIGTVINGEARAYPLKIMSWHELVNDRVGDLPILVSW
jgi:hypothetical protein